LYGARFRALTLWYDRRNHHWLARIDFKRILLGRRRRCLRRLGAGKQFEVWAETNQGATQYVERLAIPLKLRLVFLDELVERRRLAHYPFEIGRLRVIVRSGCLAWEPLRFFDGVQGFNPGVPHATFPIGKKGVCCAYAQRAESTHSQLALPEIFESGHYVQFSAATRR